ncbi:hypothetical protein TNCT_691891 [Trichonephila clavata]|uniref:Uncharacterized protein n=1 Tax=Trichonephila clavata TaxID=2740835 RepID=A0A8X6JZ82_TRICU|nr:hypothetical protein TNCT_691891 [Trichonephila clavata]
MHSKRAKQRSERHDKRSGTLSQQTHLQKVSKQFDNHCQYVKLNWAIVSWDLNVLSGAVKFYPQDAGSRAKQTLCQKFRQSAMDASSFTLRIISGKNLNLHKDSSQSPAFSHV